MPTVTDPSPAVVVNRWKDFLERVGWTIMYGAAAAFIDWATTGNPWSWRTFAIAVGLAVAKVGIAQNVGDHNDGSAIPGGVLKTKAPRR
jgi:hypothetical protein